VFFHTWRQRVHAALGGHADAVRSLARSVRPVPDLLWLLEWPGTADARVLAAAGLSQQQLTATIQEFAQIAVMPYWKKVRTFLEVERDARGRILTTGGVERLLTTLYPRIRWVPPVLEIPDERDGDVYLGGRGLLLAPSLFLFNRPAVLIDAAREDGQPMLVFSAPPDLEDAADVWDSYDRSEQALSALVGRTRAAVLEALTDTSTTGELASRLGISSAGVSQHTGVLRQAGLITTRRNRNTVLHTLTPLGLALLGGKTQELKSPLMGAAC
jgi:DNA-binding transcriptional ArsR family regulator